MQKMKALTTDEINALIQMGKPPMGTNLRVALNIETPYYCWDCKEFWRADMSRFTPEARIMVPIKPNDIKQPCPRCKKPVFPLAFPKEE